MDMVSSGLSKLAVIGSCVEKLDSTTVAQTLVHNCSATQTIPASSLVMTLRWKLKHGITRIRSRVMRRCGLAAKPRFERFMVDFPNSTSLHIAGIDLGFTSESVPNLAAICPWLARHPFVRYASLGIGRSLLL